jgi:hypothetical protein
MSTIISFSRTLPRRFLLISVIAVSAFVSFPVQTAQLNPRAREREDAFAQQRRAIVSRDLARARDQGRESIGGDWRHSATLVRA